MATIWKIYLYTAFAVFACLESYALISGNETLSVYVRSVTSTYWEAKWIGLFGFVLLAIHFWWQARA